MEMTVSGSKYGGDVSIYYNNKNPDESIIPSPLLNDGHIVGRTLDEFSIITTIYKDIIFYLLVTNNDNIVQEISNVSIILKEASDEEDIFTNLIYILISFGIFFGLLWIVGGVLWFACRQARRRRVAPHNLEGTRTHSGMKRGQVDKLFPSQKLSDVGEMESKDV